jgi:hypothetical protein
MIRNSLLGAAACLCVATAAEAQNTITGGGSATAGADYPMEQSKFNTGSGGTIIVPRPPLPPSATFSTYWAAGSGIGQQAFLADDLSCDIDAVTGANGGACTGDGGAPGNTVSYAASDIGFSEAQIESWATSGVGQSAAGNLIQLPSMGAGVAIPVNNAAIHGNGALTLSDTDLCNIFSGNWTNFSQIPDSQTTPTPGEITVFYSTAAEGPTYWLTAHLAAACSGGGFPITFFPTTNFASLFPGDVVPGNFVPEDGSAALAGAMAGCGGTTYPSALGYLTPDFTTIDPKSGARPDCRSNGPKPAKLLVAAVFTGDTPFTPTVANIALGLNNATQGQDLTPPGNATAAANPANWAPVVQTVSNGYPIVGYTLFGLAQCYTSTNVSASIQQFIADHDSVKHYAAIENNNGFATLEQVAKTGYLTAIADDLLGNVHGWNDNIGNSTICPGLPGR